MEDFIYRIAISLPAFLLAIVCHEAAHAWMAKRFGDTTGEQLGRLSLNPLVHYDLIGTVIFPLIGAMLGGTMFGWAKPVPVDTRRFKNIRSGIFWVSFAGPLANIILMFVSAILLAFMFTKVPPDFSYFQVFTEMLKSAVTINVLLAVFNLIPFPPLDGSKMVSSMLDYNNARKFEELQRYSFVFLIILIMTPVLSWIMSPALWASNLIVNIFINIFAGFLMLDTSIQVKTDHFDGPLGLLLLLVEKEEMNIRELNLTKITKQYLDYLAQMRDLNFDVAGDYLFLASTLLLLKSKVCIAEEEMKSLESEFGVEGLNITSQSELIRRLEELQLYQKMSKKLWDLEKKGHEIFVKPKVDRKAIVNSILTPMDLNSLTMTMVDFLFRQRRKYTVVKRDRLSIKEKLKFLKSNLKMGEQTTFDTLLEQDGNALIGDDQNPENLKKDKIDNIVITFISLLELARLKRIQVFQNEDRSTIYVDVVKSLEDFDVDQANGFEDEQPTPAPKEEEEVVKAANPEEKLVIEDLGEYSAEEETKEASAEEEIPSELSEAGLTQEQEDEFMDLLTTPDSVDGGSKLIQ